MPDVTVATVGALPVTVGTPTVINPFPQNITPAGVAFPVTVGVPTVVLGPAPQSIQPTGAQVSATVGSPTLTVLTGMTVAPAGFSIPVTVGTPLLTGGSTTLAAWGIQVPVVVGVPTVTGGAAVVTSIAETVRTWTVGRRSRAIRFRLTTSGPSALAKLRSVEVAHREVGRQ